MRVRADQGERKVARLIEIGLHTRSIKIALHCALSTIKLYTTLSIIKDKHIRVSDSEHAAFYSVQELTDILEKEFHSSNKKKDQDEKETK